MNVQESEFKDLLTRYKKITVIGLSSDSAKPSQRIPAYMKNHGYEVVGVNPSLAQVGAAPVEVAGMKVYGSLKDVPLEFRKFVDVFRRNEAIPQVVDEVLKAGGVEVLWLQLGIYHKEAEALAEKNGLKVISDRCLLVEHGKIF